ncbi:MAG: methyltransferase domain-containing protein [Pseudomonadota bacterium]
MQPLFDRAQIRRARARAARAPADFLPRWVAAGIEERLSEVNRAFTTPALVLPAPLPWPDPFVPALRAAGTADPVVVADDETLALTPGAHDLVLHALALHAANDPVGQLVQARRALRPDGLLVAVLLGGQTLAELRACLAEAEVALTGGLSPRVAPMGEIRELGALLGRAGLAMPVADSETLTVDYGDPRALLRDLRAMGETNALRGRRPLRRDVLAEAVARYTAAFARPDGRVTARFEVVTLTGWAPAEGQPQPLRPGSATHRLAEALGTEELGETGTPRPPRLRDD